MIPDLPPESVQHEGMELAFLQRALAETQANLLALAVAAERALGSTAPPASSVSFALVVVGSGETSSPVDAAPTTVFYADMYGTCLYVQAHPPGESRSCTYTESVLCREFAKLRAP